MGRGWIRCSLPIVALCLAACAGAKKEEAATVEPQSYGDPLLDRYASNFRYEQSDDGSTRISSDQRSSFEGAQAQGLGKEFSTKRFATEERAKEPWWGKQDYTGNKSWDGGKSANEAGRESRFGSMKPHDAGKVARGSGERYQTGTYATRQAREAGAKRLDKTEDVLTSNRRATYPEPYIIGWEKQRELSVEQTKGMLGRGE